MKLRLWRVAPTHAVPAELLRVALAPTRANPRLPRPTAGIGVDDRPKLKTTNFRYALRSLVLGARRVRALPAQLRVSEAVRLTKATGKLGVDSERIIVSVCTIAKLFFRTLLTGSNFPSLLTCKEGFQEDGVKQPLLFSIASLGGSCTRPSSAA